MRILPVIDLANGVAVHAVGGDRSTYGPLRSRLVDSGAGSDSNDTHPSLDLLRLARALRARPGLDTVYLADLDALRGGPPQWSAAARLFAEGLELWIDPGCRGAEDAAAYRKRLDAEGGATSSLIVALETWRDPSELGPLLDRFGADRFVFSLDLRAGRPLAAGSAWEPTPVGIARQAAEAGFDRMILLDVARVGRREGIVHGDTIRDLRAAVPGVRWFPGGGVRSVDDLRELESLGCAGALVGTALHDGTIRPFST
ncbi:MAG: hisA/hisF family protein [Planctomycetes bacterium]|nr:hisA/hisF family protein [Planctomycetota bacterium]